MAKNNSELPAGSPVTDDEGQDPNEEGQIEEGQAADPINEDPSDEELALEAELSAQKQALEDRLAKIRAFKAAKAEAERASRRQAFIAAASDGILAALPDDALATLKDLGAVTLRLFVASGPGVDDDGNALEGPAYEYVSVEQVTAVVKAPRASSGTSGDARGGSQNGPVKKAKRNLKAYREWLRETDPTRYGKFAAEVAEKVKVRLLNNPEETEADARNSVEWALTNSLIGKEDQAIIDRFTIK